MSHTSANPGSPSPRVWSATALAHPFCPHASKLQADPLHPPPPIPIAAGTSYFNNLNPLAARPQRSPTASPFVVRGLLFLYVIAGPRSGFVQPTR